MFGEKITPMTNGAWHCPAAERNWQPICKVLTRVLPSDGEVLEIASGTGQHVVHFASRFPRLQWQPSDPDPDMRVSIAARLAQAQLGNVHEPMDIDVLEQWPDIRVDVVMAVNLCHIAPPEVTPAFFRGCGGCAAHARVGLSLWSLQAGRRAHLTRRRAVRCLAACPGSALGDS